MTIEIPKAITYKHVPTGKIVNKCTENGEEFYLENLENSLQKLFRIPTWIVEKTIDWVKIEYRETFDKCYDTDGDGNCSECLKDPSKCPKKWMFEFPKAGVKPGEISTGCGWAPAYKILSLRKIPKYTFNPKEQFCTLRKNGLYVNDPQHPEKDGCYPLEWLLNEGWQIHAVQRADGIIFTVGDRAKLETSMLPYCPGLGYTTAQAITRIDICEGRCIITCGRGGCSIDRAVKC